MEMATWRYTQIVGIDVATRGRPVPVTDVIPTHCAINSPTFGLVHIYMTRSPPYTGQLYIMNSKLERLVDPLLRVCCRC